MAIDAKEGHGKPAADERSFAHLRATSEQLQRLRAIAPPRRSMEEWLCPPRQASAAELAELDWFLQEREALHQYDLERQQQRLTDLER